MEHSSRRLAKEAGRLLHGGWLSSTSSSCNPSEISSACPPFPQWPNVQVCECERKREEGKSRIFAGCPNKFLMLLSSPFCGCRVIHIPHIFSPRFLAFANFQNRFIFRTILERAGAGPRRMGKKRNRLAMECAHDLVLYWKDILLVVPTYVRSVYFILLFITQLMQDYAILSICQVLQIGANIRAKECFKAGQSRPWSNHLTITDTSATTI